MYNSYEYNHSKKEWKIIDDDFIEVHSSKFLWQSIIEVYERRNLNVVKNLLTAIQKYEPDYITKQELYSFVIKYTPNIKPYREELEKYMMLL